MTMRKMLRLQYQAINREHAEIAQMQKWIESKDKKLPVSAMIHVPNAAQAFDEDGQATGGQDEEERWKSYAGRCLGQLEWWGEAAKTHRGVLDPNAISPTFRTNPSERNAPS